MLRRRTGALRRATPAVNWAEVPAPSLRLMGGHKYPRKNERWSERSVEEAEAVLRGGIRLFSQPGRVNAGFPPDWHRNQLTGERVDAGQHWTQLDDRAYGDIKGVWELNRFPWAFALARAHARTGMDRYAKGFWQLFMDWCRCNPPNCGANWMCGQEATFRLMAVVFAAETLGVPDASRDAVAGFAVATGRRILANLDYALSQKNNHGVSECVGLITVALWLPEHDESRLWLARGLAELEIQLDELVYADGSFSQHSLIYLRVLLHDLAWCASRLRAAGREVPRRLAGAANRALGFLMQITEPRTGRAPLFGANDGANVLPIADGDFLDMRPVIQLTAAIFRGELPLSEGPWDEAVEWLAGPLDGLRRVPWPQRPALWHAETGGFAQLSAGESRLFLRCPVRFRHRPAQADMLHVDIWHEGKPVAQDGGSFSYNSKERFTVLGQAGHHNVLTVDRVEPLQKISRFLYLPWPKGSVEIIPDGVIRASHNGYGRLGVHWTREVSIRAGGGFVVRDRVDGAAGRKLRWHWRLADAPWQLVGAMAVVGEGNGKYSIRWSGVPAAQTELVRADGVSAFGWISNHYGEVQPACSLVIEMKAAGNIEAVFEFISAA